MKQGTAPVPREAASPPPLPFARPTMTRICPETDDQAAGRGAVGCGGGRRSGFLYVSSLFTHVSGAVIRR
jgi:hypothetical protein